MLLVSKLVGLSFGGRTVDTQLSLKEIVNRLHRSIELLNSLVKRHAASAEPVQRSEIETQMIEEISRFEAFSTKLRKAFLDSVQKHILDTSKLISSMDIHSLLSSYPNYDQALENLRKQTENNLKRFRDEESEERAKAHFLRRFARSLVHKSNSNISAAKKKIKQKLKDLKKQQEKLQAGRKEPAIKQQAIPRR